MNETKCKCGDRDQEFWDKAFVAAFTGVFNWEGITIKDGETYSQAASRISADYADAALVERNKRRIQTNNSTNRNEAAIRYLGQPCKVACDRNCAKAWGIHSRPKVQQSDNPDDYYFLSDSELCKAPDNPGTSEWGCVKPESPDEFPNKWCVRECERCARSKPNEYDKPLALESFAERVFNIPQTAKRA